MFVGSRAELLKPVEIPQLQSLDKVMQHTIYKLCLPSECGLGMSMNFVDPVSSGKYSWTFVSTAPVAELIVMSFTVP